MNVVELERPLLNVRSDDNRSTGIEQRGFDNVLSGRAGFRLRLPAIWCNANISTSLSSRDQFDLLMVLRTCAFVPETGFLDSSI